MLCQEFHLKYKNFNEMTVSYDIPFMLNLFLYLFYVL